jgi:hypothetical protein
VDTVKVVLTVLSVVIVVGPLAGLALIYRDNLAGLVLPPEAGRMVNGDVSGVVASGFVPPSLVGDPQYNSTTGAFNVSFNFTNPLANSVSVENFSASLKSSVNNAFLGTIELSKPINVSPGKTAIIDVGGNLNATIINQISNQYQQNGHIPLNIEKADATVAGVRFHVENLSIGSIQLPR